MAHNGVYYPTHMGNGTRSINVLRVGVRLGVWQRMFEYFVDDPDMENGMIDSTIVRAHPCAAGAEKKR